MKKHSTNYYDTLILPAEDCPESRGVAPPVKEGAPSVAALQYELLSAADYTMTSDDVLFEVHARRSQVGPQEAEAERAEYFSKGRPCLRSSPLTKRYGWAVHADGQGRLALICPASTEAQKLVKDETVVKKKAMRSSRA